MQDGPHIYEGFEMKHTDKTPEGIMQGKPTAKYHPAIQKLSEAIENERANYESIIKARNARLATYEAALREIAAFEGLLTQSMAQEAINIARKALEDK